jgi:hypothetical protein
MFGSRWRFEQDRAVACDGAQEFDDNMILGVSEKCMIPGFDDVLMHERFNAGKIGDHTLFGVAFGSNDITADGNFDRVAVPVEVPAPARVVGNAMTGVEFEPAGDAHREAEAEKREL